MSLQYNTSGVMTFTAGAVLPKYARVVPSSGKMVLAGTTVRGFGVTTRPAFAIDEDVPVRLRGSVGTFPAISAGAISLHAPIYAAADGKVAATGTVLLGHAMNATTGADQYVEVLEGDVA